MLVLKPPKPRYGKIKIDEIEYKFRLKKNHKMWARIELFHSIDEKYIKEIMVPKNLSIGAVVNTGEFKCSLILSEIKPISWWTKWKK